MEHMCLTLHPDAYACTLQEGHEGDHIARTPEGVAARWPQREGADMTQTAIQIAQDLRALKEQYDAAAKEAVEKAGLFEGIFAEYPALNHLRIIGYTPAFNDGDPCTHSMRVISLNTYQRDCGVWESFDEHDDGLQPNPNLAGADAKAIEELIESFEEPLEKAYGTNWQLDIIRQEDGTTKVNRDDFECGY